MKVLYIISTLARNGPVNQLYELIKYLDRARYTPSILTLSPEPDNTRYQDFVDLNVQIASMDLSRIQFLFNRRKKLYETIHKIKPDIIHTHGLRPDMLSYLYLRNHNTCSTIHNNPYEDYVYLFGNLTGRLLAFAHTRMISKIRYGVACSNYVSERLKNKYGLGDIYTVQNGIDTDFYSPVYNKMKNTYKRKLDLDEGKVTFLYVGGLNKRKDPETLIHAFKEADIGNKASLIILGDGPLKQKLKGMEDQSIQLRGFTPDVVDYMRACDAYVATSKAEGMPLTVLEALGCGMDVILSDISPHSQVISKNNAIGTMFKVGDIHGLSKLLKLYSDKDRRDVNGQSVEVANRFFSSRQMSEQYQEIYNSILNNETESVKYSYLYTAEKT